MEPVTWDEGGDGVPMSARFGEPYRSRSGGLAQARQVFMHGCGLPQRWRGAADFRVLETGFGLGLNFIATWAAWEADAQRGARLHYCAVEAYPVAGSDLLRSARQAVRAQSAAHAAAPREAGASSGAAPHDARIAALAVRLARAWADCRPGLQTWDLGDPPDASSVRLTLAFGDVLPMLDALAPLAPLGVDAVYLDGFSPAVNPAMWSPAVLRAVARQMRPGARLASYTTDRTVRDALAASGLQVARRPGLAPKRHRLEAVR